MIVMEALAAVVALVFADRSKRATRQKFRISLGVTAAAIALPLLGTIVAPFSAGPPLVMIAGAIGMLVLSLVDPRPLVAIGVAVLTPVATGLVGSLAFNAGRGVRPVLTIVLVVGVAVVSLRSRALLRRLQTR